MTKTSGFQAAHHPIRGLGFSIQATNYATRKATAQVRSFHLHGEFALAGRGHWRHFWQLQISARCSVQVTSHADKRQCVTTVRRQLDFNTRIIKVGIFADIHPNRGIIRENPQTIVIFTRTQFASRAKHPEGELTTQLRFLNLETTR